MHKDVNTLNVHQCSWKLDPSLNKIDTYLNSFKIQNDIPRNKHNDHGSFDIVLRTVGKRAHK